MNAYYGCITKRGEVIIRVQSPMFNLDALLTERSDISFAWDLGGCKSEVDAMIKLKDKVQALFR